MILSIYIRIGMYIGQFCEVHASDAASLIKKAKSKAKKVTFARWACLELGCGAGFPSGVPSARLEREAQNVCGRIPSLNCFPTTFPDQIPSQIQPTCCSWCWTLEYLESWQLVATQQIKQVLSCCTFGCYRLCFGYGAIDLGPGFGFLGRLVKNILCCWKTEGSEGRF